MTPLKNRVLNDIQGEIELARLAPHTMKDNLLEVIKIAESYIREYDNVKEYIK